MATSTTSTTSKPSNADANEFDASHMVEVAQTMNQANTAINNVSAQIPQGTKDFVQNAKSKLLDKDKLRSFSLFFGVGESKSFNIACNPTILCPRLKHNLFFFYLNYILICAFVFVLTTLAILITPQSLIVLGCLGVAWLFVIRSTREGSFQIKGITITRKQASFFMMVASALVAFFLLKDIFWVTLSSSALLSFLHALTRDSSHEIEEGGLLEMCGQEKEVVGETV